MRLFLTNGRRLRSSQILVLQSFSMIYRFANIIIDRSTVVKSMIFRNTLIRCEFTAARFSDLNRECFFYETYELKFACCLQSRILSISILISSVCALYFNLRWL